MSARERWRVPNDVASPAVFPSISIRKIDNMSVGSSTRIEGVRLRDDEVENLLSGLDVRSFRSRDEQEVAGYAELMELIFESYADIPFTENAIRQLHGILLKYSHKNERHRGSYKTLSNNVEAFDLDVRSIGIILKRPLRLTRRG